MNLSLTNLLVMFDFPTRGGPFSHYLNLLRWWSCIGVGWAPACPSWGWQWSLSTDNIYKFRNVFWWGQKISEQQKPTRSSNLANPLIMHSSTSLLKLSIPQTRSSLVPPPLPSSRIPCPPVSIPCPHLSLAKRTFLPIILLAWCRPSCRFYTDLRRRHLVGH